MNYTNKLENYNLGVSDSAIAAIVAKAKKNSTANHNADVYKLCYGCIDLTSLNVTDSESSIAELARKAMDFGNHFPDIPNVASLCVYPVFVETAGVVLGDSGLRITSVAGGFPSSQTYLEVKMLEIAMAAENGADEIDMVMNVGQMLTGDYELLANEIELIGGEIGGYIVLKVIIESGALINPSMVRTASLLSMMAGADFVKTSTGKIPVAATPEAAVVICEAIRDYRENTGRKVGFKAAGGIKTSEDAALYYTIVKTVLGEEWLNPSLFRIGTSSAANTLLSSITGSEVKYF
ncbi:deoxyribose-phosphate aldolase [Holotrichia oblita]|uniref:Deoxyribose-phosphate aldolase n=1 Tax=Holotrichia oblita TaxID=644536 RepID=A0ACB9TR09_HOLOL|nr:deoxyribose-phosphate aldolase [Holotrichia oblita]